MNAVNFSESDRNSNLYGQDFGITNVKANKVDWECKKSKHFVTSDATIALPAKIIC